MVTLPHPFRPQGYRLLQGRRNLVAQSKVELKGKGAKNWIPAPGEGHRKVSSLVWALGWLCWLRGQFPGLRVSACGTPLQSSLLFSSYDYSI